ncbi:hypothetical protein ABK040_000438 [Willaertia magna]
MAAAKATSSNKQASLKEDELSKMKSELKKVENDETKATSLFNRPFDFVLIGFYLTFIASTAFFDYHTVIAPALGVTVRDLIDKDIDRPLNWPPAGFTKSTYKLYGEKVDPIMINNPFFWQLMEWINVIFMTLGNILMASAFIFGWKSFRAFGIIHATSLLYSLILCLGVGLFGEPGYEAVDKFQFVTAYSLYLTFPFVIIGRLWRESPNAFSLSYVKSKPISQHLLQAFCLVHIVFFVSFFYHWIIVNDPELLPWLPEYPIVGQFFLRIAKLKNL